VYEVHSCVPDLHASYEGIIVKIYRNAAISLVTSGTQEVPSTMQGCTLLSVLFLRREEKNQKKHPPPLNLTFGRLLSRLGRVQVKLASPLAVPSVPPIWGDLTAPPVALTLRYAQTIKGLAYFLSAARSFFENTLRFSLRQAQGPLREGALGTQKGLRERAARLENTPHEEVFRGCPIFGAILSLGSRSEPRNEIRNAV